MNNDSTRNKLDFKLFCAKHPETELNFSSDLSKVGASSAYEMNIKIVVHPCDKCQQESERIKSAVDVLLSIKDDRKAPRFA